MGKNLPIIIRSRIVELETEILLNLMWKNFDQKSPEILHIFSEPNPNSQLAIKRLLNIKAERVYLITSK